MPESKEVESKEVESKEVESKEVESKELVKGEVLETIDPVQKGVSEMIDGLKKSQNESDEKTDEKKDEKPVSLAKHKEMMKADFNKNKQILFEKCKSALLEKKVTAEDVNEIETFYNSTGRMHPDYEGILGSFE